MTVGIFLAFLFLAGVVLNAFFAGYETGFVACNPIRVRHLAEKESQRNARHLAHHLNQPDRMLTTVLLGTNLALIMGTVALTSLLGGLWATVVGTLMFVTFGEIVPKSMFRVHPTRLALALMPAIRFSGTVLAPMVWPVTWASRGIVALVQGGENRDLRLLMRSPEDMRVLVDESADHGTIEEEEKEMIHSVMDLQTQSAKEVMVPRIAIQGVADTAARSELIDLLKESGRTRIPVYQGSMDTIVGVVNAFDVLRETEAPEESDIARLVRPVMHVHDTMKLDDVLRSMRDEKQSMAVVTDEYGGTDGLVTLEDILEEIFGEIRDEYDEEQPSVRKVGPNDYVIEARTPLEEAAEAMVIELSDEEVDTVGGWVMRSAGRIPQQGEVMLLGRYRVTILDGSANSVARIRLEVLAGPEEDEEIRA